MAAPVKRIAAQLAECFCLLASIEWATPPARRCGLAAPDFCMRTGLDVTYRLMIWVVDVNDVSLISHAAFSSLFGPLIISLPQPSNLCLSKPLV